LMKAKRPGEELAKLMDEARIVVSG